MVQKVPLSKQNPIYRKRHCWKVSFPEEMTGELSLKRKEACCTPKKAGRLLKNILLPQEATIWNTSTEFMNLLKTTAPCPCRRGTGWMWSISSKTHLKAVRRRP